MQKLFNSNKKVQNEYFFKIRQIYFCLYSNLFKLYLHIKVL